MIQRKLLEREMFRLMTNLGRKQTSHIFWMTSFWQQKEKTVTKVVYSFQMQGQWAEDSSLFKSKVIYGGRS